MFLRCLLENVFPFVPNVNSSCTLFLYYLGYGRFSALIDPTAQIIVQTLDKNNRNAEKAAAQGTLTPAGVSLLGFP